MSFLLIWFKLVLWVKQIRLISTPAKKESNVPIFTEEEGLKLYFQSQFLKYKTGGFFFPTQDKNQPKAGFCPSGFIIFGQQKTCAPIRIFT